MALRTALLIRLFKALYERLGYPPARLTDQSADGYFYTMLSDADCDIVIIVNGDCFITAPQAVFCLVEYVIAIGYANAGCSDSGQYMRAGQSVGYQSILQRLLLTPYPHQVLS